MPEADGTAAQQPAAAASSGSGSAAVKRRVAVLICGVPPQAVLDTAGTYGDQFSRLLQQGSTKDEDWQFWNAYQVQVDHSRLCAVPIVWLPHQNEEDDIWSECLPWEATVGRGARGI